MMRAVLIALALLFATDAFADPRTCSEALQVCLRPFGRVCDGGCQSTCVMRFNGCLKSGAFSTPGKLFQGLKRV